MFRNLGTVEIIIIAAVILLLFGGKKLPELARGVSEASSEFNKGLKGDKASKKKTAKSKEDTASKSN